MKKPVTPKDQLADYDRRIPKIVEALDLLRDARVLLRQANADNAADYVARALKSADGARRHAHGRRDRILNSIR